MKTNSEFIFNGKVTFVGDVREGVSKQGKPFSTQWFVVENQSGRFTQRMAFSLMNDKLAENAQNLRIDNEVAVHFDTDYREKKDQNTGAVVGFYPDIIAYQIDLLYAANVAEQEDNF